MNTHTITTYFFNELSNEAKQKAIDNDRYLLTNYNWWKDTIQDAKNVFGIVIHSFDFERGQRIDIDYMDNLENIATKIIEEWGPNTALNKDAHCYLQSRSKILTEAKKDEDVEILDSELLEEKLDENDNSFKDDIDNTFLKMLEQEYEWLISDECIGELLEANQYEFLENGKRY
jgi:hypothetical protein